jgi:hypothetical protein
MKQCTYIVFVGALQPRRLIFRFPIVPLVVALQPRRLVFRFPIMPLCLFKCLIQAYCTLISPMNSGGMLVVLECFQISSFGRKKVASAQSVSRPHDPYPRFTKEICSVCRKSIQSKISKVIEYVMPPYFGKEPVIHDTLGKKSVLWNVGRRTRIFIHSQD